MEVARRSCVVDLVNPCVEMVYGAVVAVVVVVGIFLIFSFIIIIIITVVVRKNYY